MKEAVSLLLAKVHYPVHSLGYGKRVGIWLQGCSVRCEGCLNRETWEFDEAARIPVQSLVERVEGWLAEADGVTVSGGEPFDQPEALGALLVLLRERTAGDLLVYSGRSAEYLRENHAGLLGLIDVLITDPYRPGSGQTLTLRGSDNQRVWLLSEEAKRRYPATVNGDAWEESERRMDLLVEGETVWMAGIPRPGDLEKLEKLLAERGMGVSFSLRGGGGARVEAGKERPLSP